MHACWRTVWGSGKTKRQEVETEDFEKCVKLTEVVSSKSKEITELKNE